MILLFSKEFELITKDISMNNEFMKLNTCIHHGISRLDHSYRVAYYSYKIMKFLKLNLPTNNLIDSLNLFISVFNKHLYSNS